MWLFELWFGHWLQRNSKLFCHGHKIICQNFLVPNTFSKQSADPLPWSARTQQHTYIRHLISHDPSNVRAFGTQSSHYIQSLNFCTVKENIKNMDSSKSQKDFKQIVLYIYILISNLKNLSRTYPYLLFWIRGYVQPKFDKLHISRL